MERYALADHVFVCVDGEQVVLLDLREDRYWALESARTAGLGSLVTGWPMTRAEHHPGARADEPNTSDFSTVLELLCGHGLLIEPVSRGKDATPVSAATPVTDFGRPPWITKAARSLPAAGATVWWTFLWAAVRAGIALRFRPFERVVDHVKRRKLAARWQTADIELARDLVAAFARYRVFLFSARNECLYDSLALLEFLAGYGLYPDWVFGVQTRPFMAHCWVQQDGVVFNDSVEHVIGYTPIMVV